MPSCSVASCRLGGRHDVCSPQSPLQPTSAAPALILATPEPHPGPACSSLPAWPGPSSLGPVHGPQRLSAPAGRGRLWPGAMDSGDAEMNPDLAALAQSLPFSGSEMNLAGMCAHPCRLPGIEAASLNVFNSNAYARVLKRLHLYCCMIVYRMQSSHADTAGTSQT